MWSVLGSWFAAHGVELVISVIGLVWTKQKAGESRKDWLKNVGTGAFHALEDLAAKDPKLKGNKAVEALALVDKRLTDGGKKPLTADEKKFLGEIFWTMAHAQKTAAPK